MWAVRAIETLEQVGTPEATQLLEHIARGQPDPGPTVEAKAALKRFAQRGAS